MHKTTEIHSFGMDQMQIIFPQSSLIYLRKSWLKLMSLLEDW